MASTLEGIFWPYVVLYELVRSWLKRDERTLDLLVHSISLLCSIAGLAIFPFLYYHLWWWAAIASAIYALPPAIVVLALYVLLWDEREEREECEYDATWLQY